MRGNIEVVNVKLFCRQKQYLGAKKYWLANVGLLQPSWWVVG